MTGGTSTTPRWYVISWDTAVLSTHARKLTTDKERGISGKKTSSAMALRPSCSNVDAQNGKLNFVTTVKTLESPAVNGMKPFTLCDGNIVVVSSRLATLRLIGGPTAAEGKVEVYHE